MANGGWYGTVEEWKRIEAPLIGVDSIISTFARQIGVVVTKNLKDWPERSLRWGKEIDCLIQIYLADADDPTWNIWICCSNDRDGKRYWKKEFLIEKQPISEFKDRLFDLLEEGRKRLADWSSHPETLEFVTTLASG